MNKAIKYKETRRDNVGTQISEDIFPSGGHGRARVLRLFVLVDIPSCHDSPLFFHDEGTKGQIR